MAEAPFPYVIEQLGRDHTRDAFDCGVAALDDYLRRQASQDERRRVARVFIARPVEAGVVVGYFALSAASFSRDELPYDLVRRLPRYPIPAVRLGRLAVDRAHQGRGLGRYLLFDALNRVLGASQTVAIYAVLVDAKADSVAFHTHYGFQPLPARPTELFLPLETLRRAASVG